MFSICSKLICRRCALNVSECRLSRVACARHFGLFDFRRESVQLFVRNAFAVALGARPSENVALERTQYPLRASGRAAGPAVQSSDTRRVLSAHHSSVGQRNSAVLGSRVVGKS